MQVMKCFCPSLYDHFDHNGIKVYGWLQAGYTQNFGSPSDRLNNGVNFNSRSNDFLFNQAYFVIEKTLDLDKKKDEVHFGYRVDFMAESREGTRPQSHDSRRGSLAANPQRHARRRTIAHDSAPARR